VYKPATMRKHSLWFLSLLFAAALLLGGRAVLTAQQSTSSAAKSGRWCDAATWADKKVPADGALVTIGQGMDVVLDASTPPLHGLTINGKLSFANNKDVELTTEWIMLHGELEIGTEKAPHTRKAKDIWRRDSQGGYPRRDDIPGARLIFAKATTAPAKTQGRVLDHTGVGVKNVNEFCEKLASKGVTCERPMGNARPIAMVTDPFGVRVEINEGLEAR
jgi:G8 domain